MSCITNCSRPSYDQFAERFDLHGFRHVRKSTGKKIYLKVGSYFTATKLHDNDNNNIIIPNEILIHKIKN